jgi:hypothetical protein
MIKITIKSPSWSWAVNQMGNPSQDGLRHGFATYYVHLIDNVPAVSFYMGNSPFRSFVVHCNKCGSFKLIVISEFDEESGQAAIFLFCPYCREREKMPVR